MESVQRELEPVKQEQQSEQPKEEKLSAGKSVFVGFQHVLAMDLFIPPIILAGLATLIQAGFAMKLPVMQGPSFVPLSALAAIGTTSGIGAMIGSLIPGAILIALIGRLKLFSKVVKKFIPPIVAGTVIVVVGISLMPSAISSIYNAPGNANVNMMIAFISAAILIVCMYIGEKATQRFRFVKLASVILALGIGTIIASFYGMVDFSSVKESSWIAFPSIFAFGMPTFELDAILIMLAIYLIIVIETTGTWFTVAEVTDKKLDEKRLNGGAVGEGIGCLTGSFFGGTPVTGYSSNAGIIAVTGIKSRKPILVGGVILILLGMMPKLTSIIASIPVVVINGVFAVLCVVIMMNGLKVIKNEPFTERNMIVIGVPIMLALFAVMIPQEVMNGLPNIITYFVASGTAVGAIGALVLNIVLPETIEDKKPIKPKGEVEYAAR